MSAPSQRVDCANAWQYGHPTDERRAELRAKTIFAYGRLIVGGKANMCQIRDISPRGISIEAQNLPQPGERVRIEMRGIAPSPATVVWRDGLLGGLAFDEDQDLQRIFQTRQSQVRYQPRSPRFALSLPAVLEGAEGTTLLEAIDISKGGLKLRGETPLAIGSTGLVRVADHEEAFAGHVVWKRSNRLGFRFDGPVLRSDLLTRLGKRG